MKFMLMRGVIQCSNDTSFDTSSLDRPQRSLQLTHVDGLVLLGATINGNIGTGCGRSDMSKENYGDMIISRLPDRCKCDNLINDVSPCLPTLSHS